MSKEGKGVGPRANPLNAPQMSGSVGSKVEKTRGAETKPHLMRRSPSGWSSFSFVSAPRFFLRK